MSIINNDKKKWQVRNTTNNTIVIGDLDKVPSMPPNTSHNLLRYATEDEDKIQWTISEDLSGLSIFNISAACKIEYRY